MYLTFLNEYLFILLVVPSYEYFSNMFQTEKNCKLDIYKIKEIIIIIILFICQSNINYSILLLFIKFKKIYCKLDILSVLINK